MFTLKQFFCSFVLCSAGAVAVKQFAVRCCVVLKPDQFRACWRQQVNECSAQMQSSCSYPVGFLEMPRQQSLSPVAVCGSGGGGGNGS